MTKFPVVFRDCDILVVTGNGSTSIRRDVYGLDMFAYPEGRFKIVGTVWVNGDKQEVWTFTTNPDDPTGTWVCKL